MKQVALSALLITVLVAAPELGRAAQPNFVLFLVDDLGYGDLGCYGSERNKTPNIDRLAGQGARLTDFHSNGPMCSATRAALLTGCYQQRFGRQFDGALSPGPAEDNGLPLDAVTIAEVLRHAGYSTGMFGKWHLGYSPPLWPTHQGFNEFIGLGSGDGDHHTHIDRSGNEDWWKNDELCMEEGYTSSLITRHSTDFIRRHKAEPFFLFVSHLAIHFPWQGSDDPPHRVKGRNYDNDKWGIVPDRRNVAPHVEAMIEAIDQSVGEIVATLRECGLAEDTLVIFASDNGGYLQYANSHFNISSNGPLKGQKGGVEEGGHRVPCIIWWPGQIRAGQVIRTTLMTIDIFPTLVDFAGARMPENQRIDGVDAVPSLLRGESLPERIVYWRKDDERAARLGPWKLNLSDAEPSALYHLDSDIGETTNVAERHPEIVNRLKSAWFAWEEDVNNGFLRGQ